MGRRKQAWTAGDLFLVPLKDGEFSLGQVVSHEPDALNSVLCGFYDIPVDEDPSNTMPEKLGAESLVAILLVTRDLLDSGDWRIVGNLPPANLESFQNLDTLRTQGFVGASIVGSGNVVKFLNALRGLHPWDAFADPDYFDRFLVSPKKKPPNLVFQRDRSDHS